MSLSIANPTASALTISPNIPTAPLQLFLVYARKVYDIILSHCETITKRYVSASYTLLIRQSPLPIRYPTIANTSPIIHIKAVPNNAKFGCGLKLMALCQLP